MSARVANQDDRDKIGLWTHLRFLLRCSSRAGVVGVHDGVQARVVGGRDIDTAAS